jgi:hypothetical protein
MFWVVQLWCVGLIVQSPDDLKQSIRSVYFNDKIGPHPEPLSIAASLKYVRTPITAEVADAAGGFADSVVIIDSKTPYFTSLQTEVKQVLKAQSLGAIAVIMVYTSELEPG